MKTLVYCKNEAMLDGFKFGAHFRHWGATYTQSVDGADDYWLLIEDDTDGDNQTYELDEWGGGLKHIATGVEI